VELSNHRKAPMPHPSSLSRRKTENSDLFKIIDQ